MAPPLSGPALNPHPSRPAQSLHRSRPAPGPPLCPALDPHHSPAVNPPPSSLHPRLSQPQKADPRPGPWHWPRLLPWPQPRPGARGLRTLPQKHLLDPGDQVGRLLAQALLAFLLMGPRGWFILGSGVWLTRILELCLWGVRVWGFVFMQETRIPGSCHSSPS